jgi:TATA-box binding protein (TBP) (component of TFIID and TFIIIB)
MTVFERNKNRVLIFEWDRVDGSPLLTGSQTNMVAQCHVVNRYTGRLYALMERNADGSSKDEEDNVVDFSRISFKSRDARFRAQRQMTPASPCNTMLTSLTGVLVSTGTKTAAGAFESMAATVRILRNYLRAGKPEFILAGVTNVNAPYSGYFRYKLDLDMVQGIDDGRYVITYEKDVFPGARIRRVGKTGVVLLFKTGKYVFVGKPTAITMSAAVREIEQFIDSHPEVHVPLGRDDIQQRVLDQAKRARTQEICNTRAKDRLDKANSGRRMSMEAGEGR